MKFGPLHNSWKIALVVAISHQTPNHAELLVKHGANVNGFPKWCFSAASSRSVRGRPPSLKLSAGSTLSIGEKFLINIGTPVAQNHGRPFTKEELAEHRLGRSRVLGRRRLSKA